MKNTKAVTFIVFCLLIGLGAGIVQAAGLSALELRQLETQLSEGFQKHAWQSGVFIQSVLKNGVVMLLLWGLMFIPAGRWIGCGILIFKAMGYGFTGGVLVRTYGGAGVSYILTRLGPQALILLPVAMFLCIVLFQRSNDSRRTEVPLTSYAAALMIAELCVVLASFI